MTKHQVHIALRELSYVCNAIRAGYCACLSGCQLTKLGLQKKKKKKAKKIPHGSNNNRIFKDGKSILILGAGRVLKSEIS